MNMVMKEEQPTHGRVWTRMLQDQNAHTTYNWYNKNKPFCKDIIQRLVATCVEAAFTYEKHSLGSKKKKRYNQV